MISIQGFDQNGDIADVKFPEDGDVFFEMQFFLRPATNRTLFSPSRDNSTLRLGCSYFNIRRGTWDESGMRLISYDP